MSGWGLGLVAACAITCGALACGRSDLDDAVIGAAGATAGHTPSMTGGAGGGGSGAGGGGAVTSFGCAAGDPDQTCNDDPSVSALWGTCAPSGGCLCNDGFSYDAATGKCRPGSLCVASGADPWAFSIDLPALDCASRPATACAAVEDDDPLQFTVGMFLGSACGLTELTYVRVVLTDGCPTLVEMKPVSSGATLDPALTACVSKALAQQRWSCAAPIDCALIEWDTLP